MKLAAPLRVVPDPTPEQEAGLDFYVTIYDEAAPRLGFLLGPYSTHREARDNVSRGDELAHSADPWSHFWAKGTVGVPRGTAVKTVFGR